MAAQMSGSTVIAANATNPNLLTGQLFEFIQTGSLVKFYLNSSAAGLLVSIICGSESLMQEGGIRFTNTFPSTQDDQIVTSYARPGDRVLVSVRNTTGAAITIFWKVEVQTL